MGSKEERTKAYLDQLTSPKFEDFHTLRHTIQMTQVYSSVYSNLNPNQQTPLFPLFIPESSATEEYYAILARAQLLLSVEDVIKLAAAEAGAELGNLPTTKSTKMSTKARTNGNEYFKRKNYSAALKEYTRSVSLANPKSEELKFAYANRSELLLRRGYYKESLEDIERALEHDYPENKKSQLIARREKVLGLLPEQKTERFHEELPKIENKNLQMPAASDCIKLSKTEQSGTFIEATRDISVGEILLVEKPYAFTVVLENNLLKFCSECGELCRNMISCDKCPALYCSIDCKQTDAKNFHGYECIVQRCAQFYLQPNGVAYEVALPLKMTIRALKDMKEKKHEQNEGFYHSDCYEEIQNLVDHKEHMLRDHTIRVTAHCVDLVKIFFILIKCTNIKEKFNIDSNFLRTLLFRNYLIRSYNSTSPVFWKKIEKTCTEAYANAIYATFSRFNHACCPNSRFFFYGSTILVRSIRKIMKGEQCFICYKPYYVTDPLYERQAYLQKKYNFNCQCKACKDDWPMTVKLMLDFSGTNFELAFDGNKKYGNKKPAFYENLKSIYTFVFSKKELTEEKKEKIFNEVVQIHSKMSAEPSLNYYFLDVIYDKLFASCNREIEF